MYESFAAVTLLVLGLLILLARASEAMFDDPADGEDGQAERAGTRDRESPEVPATGAARIERHRDTGLSRAERIEREVLDDEADRPEDGSPWADDAGVEVTDAEASPWGENPAEADARRAGGDTSRTDADVRRLDLSPAALLLNVAVSQGLFGAVLVGAIWLGNVPLSALGVVPGAAWNAGLPAVGLGVAVGVALYVADELAAAALDAAGVEYAESVRDSLAPDSTGGWVVLLGVVLPVIAGFEELLFRAALIGAFATGFGVSPWLLAVASTVAFAAGHGAQGPGGIVVTGALGFALAAAYVLTGSLLVVVVAHYVVNALEFAVHEGLGIEWA